MIDDLELEVAGRRSRGCLQLITSSESTTNVLNGKESQSNLSNLIDWLGFKWFGQKTIADNKVMQDSMIHLYVVYQSYFQR